jgi:triacylglycerol esterase/lipase EstA (alpha/beta hydrolase family)
MSDVHDVHHIYLIPGFFGFANLGRLRYFVHVYDFLVQRCAALGVPVEIHVVKTHPTSSLALRAARLADTVAASVRDRRGGVHLIGHSTGGLDARLFTAPGVSLPTPADVERQAVRVRSVITIATPHFGTPLASALATRRGQRLLGLLSLGTSYLLRFGHLPMSALLQFADIFRSSELLGAQRTLLDELSQRLLADFSVARRRAVQRLLVEVINDQSLLVQASPESMDLFNATVRDRPGVRYRSIVTRARPPGVASTLAAGLDPVAQATHAIYQGIYRLAAGTPPSREYPLTAHNRRILQRAYGSVPRLRANDGIVPTRSQVWGEILQAVQADHLDAIGHFNDPAAHPPHFDWLTTGSGFGRQRFEALWERVVDSILGNVRAPERAHQAPRSRSQRLTAVRRGAGHGGDRA